MSHKSDEGLGLQPLERLPTAIAGVIGFGAVIVEIWHLFHFFLDATGDGNSALHVLSAYLWTSLAAIMILGLTAAWYHHRLGVRVGELRVREAAIQLQHLLAEEVRRCAADPRKYEWKSFETASHRIREFLALRLPGVQCSITVKKVEGSRLRAVFRDPDQDLAQRLSSNDLPLTDSHVYRSFRVYSRGQKRWVYIRDTDNVPPADRAYSERARTCGFRSVIAFPLREPVKMTGADVAGLRGFWSLDADDANAFIDLFRADRLRRHGDNDGKGLMPRADIQAFYGVADCIATILMLMDSAAATEGEEDANP